MLARGDTGVPISSGSEKPPGVMLAGAVAVGAKSPPRNAAAFSRCGPNWWFTLSATEPQVPLWTVAKILGNTTAVVEKTYAKWAPAEPERNVDLISGGKLEMVK